MKHSVTLVLTKQNIAVERFLRVVRHRGFDLVHFQLNVVDGQYHVAMLVESDKPIHLLTTQLTKLVDVKAVVLQNLEQAV